MKKFSPRSILTLAMLMLPGLGTSAFGAELSDTQKGERLFSLQVSRILSEKCFSCHGGDEGKIKGDLDLTSLEAMLQGGETISDVLVPGDSARSFILDSVEWKDPDYEMPPKENDRLTAAQIDHLRSWIDLGAPWPNDATREKYLAEERLQLHTEEGVIVPTSGGLSDDWTYRRYEEEDLWAFQPLEKPAIPSLGEADPTNPIDRFVGARLKSAGFSPAPQADAATLIRRVSYSVIGLPPTPEEVAEFEKAFAENSTQAWDELVSRLLDSRHYGERWAQHWLDVARYADTAGFSNDYERSNAWRYRDYVIRAFNEDKPYNEFIREQIAGDEMADQSLRGRSDSEDAFRKARLAGEYTEEEAELLVASSFLRMGPWDPAMVKKPEARQLYVDDVVNAVGQTFLATTMRCFKCHDHKFDPLPTRDYYRMYSIFSTTQLAERPAPFLKDESLDRFDEGEALVQELLTFAQNELGELKAKSEAADDEWHREHGIPKPEPGTDLKTIPDDRKPPRHVGLNEEEKGQLKVREQDEWIWNRRLERFEPLVQSVYNGPMPKFLNARKLRLDGNPDPNWDAQSYILSGGALEAQGEKVTPGVLSVLGLPTGEGTEDDPYAVPDSFDGRRLALADWIADDGNGLTARAFVNRIWQYHFGKPLAGNPNNFGVTGKKPTHPELLDWLAADFVEHGWKVKRLHRLILSSRTWQQSSSNPAQYELAQKDANNDLFAYFPTRRLTAEEIRDSMLRITGELNPEGGGLPIMPEMNMEVALQPRMIQFSLAPAYQPSRTPEDRNRRSIYAYRVRGLADPFLETFNQPNPNDSCEERDSASVSPQAFTLLNSDLMTDRSIAFALRVEEEAATPMERVRRAMELAFGRIPTGEEEQTLLRYLQEMKAYHADVPVHLEDYPTKITRTLVEEFSGQPFTYEEILPVFEDYVPDPKAANVSPETRALADLCLALFNSNEFVYVY